MRRAIGHLSLVALLSSCGPCSRKKAPEDPRSSTQPPVAASNAKPDVAQRKAPAPLAAVRPLEFVVAGWTKAGLRGGEKVGAQRARRAFLLATAGTRFAVTGEGRVILNAGSTEGAETPQRITRAGDEFGLARSEARALVPDPGGHAALATGQAILRTAQPNPLHAQKAVRDALSKLAKQTGGSGRILVVRVGRLRLQKRTLSVEVTARILADGH
jgi:hypothetical protein